MKDKLIRNGIEVRKSSIQGYGVFATHEIKKAAIIEECYLLQIPCETTSLKNYLFNCSELPDDNRKALALGFGSIYNHAEIANAIVIIDVDNKLVTFIAARDITANEEILVDYGPNWFMSRGTRTAQLIKSKNKWLIASFKLVIIVLLMLMFHFISIQFFSF